MSLTIIVCLKQVPDPEHFDKIRLDPQSKTIIRAGIPSIINPLDRNALEEALKIKERVGGKVIGISAGPPQAKQAMEEALAMGVDEAILLCDMSFAGADSLATVNCLAGGIRKIGSFDLVLCGNETADGATAQVPAQLAEVLDLPHVTAAEKIDFVEEKKIVIERLVENGHMKVEVLLPAVIAVTKTINEPRLPTMLGIIEAAGKPLSNLCREDIGQQACNVGWEGSPTRTWDVFESKHKREAVLFKGKPEEAVKLAVKRLKEKEAF